MIATVIDRAGDQLGDFLPRIAGALILLIVGLLAAIVLGRLTRRALDELGGEARAHRRRLAADEPQQLHGARLGRLEGRIGRIAHSGSSQS